MLNKKYLVSGILLAATMSLPFTAHGAQPGFYIGAGLGQGDDVILNQTSAAYKVFGGFNFNPFLGLEVAYVNLGSNYVDSFNNTFTQDGSSFDIVGYLPVSPYVDIFGKAGIFNWTISNNYSYYAYSQGTSSDYGFGIDAQVNRQVWVRGEYQKFVDVAGGDVNLASVSVSYHF